MSEQTCKNCAVWQEEDIKGMEVPVGGCPLLSDYVAREDEDYGYITWNNSFKTQSDFGCNQWQEK